MSRDIAETSAGFIAIIGAPNAGKSTLVNALVGAKVSIVSPKVQTTRTRVLGIYVDGAAQVALIDTPGIFAPKRRLDRAMVAAAWSGAGDADGIALLVDAERGLSGDVQAIVQNLQADGRKATLVLNKIDRVKKDILLHLTSELTASGCFAQTFMISALKGDGVEDLKAHFSAAVPPGPWLFPEDEMSDMPQRLLAAEITREQLYLQLHQELPYQATVETESWEQQTATTATVRQVIYISRANHKGIVLGKQGSRIKAIGEAARRELQGLLDMEVHLFLHVKVRERWQDDPERYRDWGLDFDS